MNHECSSADRSANPVMRRRFTRRLMLLLIAAAVIRLAMFVDFLRSHPSANYVQGDAAVYWSGAERIASGSFLDHQPFLSTPLYMVLLAPVRRLGGGLTWVYALQIAVHLATAAGLAWYVGRRLDDTTGLVAAALFLLLEEPAFFVNRVLPSTWQLLLVVTLLISSEGADRTISKGRCALLGASAGLMSLVYPPAVVLLFVVPVWVWRRAATGAGDDGRQSPPEPRTAAWEGAVLTFLVAAGCVLPATVHNWLACGEFIPITAHAGITFNQGNTPGAQGVYTPLPGVSNTRERMHQDAARLFARENGRTGRYAEIDRYFLRRGGQYLLEDPGRSARLAIRKTYWFLTGRYYGDLYYPALEQADGWVHLMPLAPVKTAWLMGPAMVGLMFMGKRRRLGVMEVSILVLPILVVTIFWYSPRYRLPVIPMLVVLAGAALTEAVRAWRASGWRRYQAICVVVATALGMSTGFWNRWSGFDAPELYRPQYEYNRGYVFAGQGRFAEAVPYWESSARLGGPPETLIALVDAYRRLDQWDNAEHACRRLQESDPDVPTTWLSCGAMHLYFHRIEDALTDFQKARNLDPTSGSPHFGLWLASQASGQLDEGLKHLREAVRVTPDDPLAVCALGEQLLNRQDYSEAESWLQRCVRLSPNDVESLVRLGMTLKHLDRWDEAGESFRKALTLNPRHDEALGQLQSIQPNSLDTTARVEAIRTRIRELPTQASFYSELAGLLYQSGDPKGAIEVLRQGVRSAEEKATLALEGAWILSTVDDRSLRDGYMALALVDQACGIEVRSVECLDVRAAALAEIGSFDAAATLADEAAKQAMIEKREPLAREIQSRADTYRARRGPGR